MNAPTQQRPANFCDSCTIRNRAICGGLNDDEIALLNRVGRRKWVKAGEQLLWEGDEAVLVANVIEGVMKLSTQTADGKEQILGLAFPSDFLGRPFGETAPYGVEALTDSHVCVFERKEFDRFAQEHPALESRLLRRTLDELDRTRKSMLMLGRLTAQQRVASFLLEVAERTEHDSAETPLELPLSRQQMADLLGLTIETVSRQLGKLRKQGLIDVPSRREVLIRDRDALELLAE